MRTQTHLDFEKLKVRYTGAFFLIFFLTVAIEATFQSFLAGQELNIRMINIAGNQRMLSQRVAKNTLLLETDLKEQARAQAAASLKHLVLFELLGQLLFIVAKGTLKVRGSVQSYVLTHSHPKPKFEAF